MKSYGRVASGPGGRGWLVEAEPYVMLRLKRVFQRLDKAPRGYVLFGNSAENGRELLWFLDRYPMAVEPDARARLEARAREHREREAMIEAVLADDYTPRRFTMALPPRQYQAVAADVVLRSGSLLLADDVGTGKTVVAICAFSEPRTLPALVVTLTHLPLQWMREILRFAPALRVHILKKGTPYPLPPADVIISNYHKLGGWAETLAPRIRSLVFDECQELRTGNGIKYAAAGHLAAKATYRLGLSATPLFGYGGEIWNVLNVLAPDALGTRAEFVREWCGYDYGPKTTLKNPKAFGLYLRDQGLMLRRTRADVGRELPPVSRVLHHVDADLHALEAVRTTASELAQIILAQSPLDRGAKFRASEELSYLLRQATGVAKAPHVAAFVRLLVENGERVVLYGWHHGVYDLWRELLHDLKPAFYTGAESVPQKEEARKRFLAGDTPVLIMSLRAGAGLDGLQGRCRTVVFGELDWSPGVHEQALGRIHRDGQGDPVLVYFLITDVGADPVIVDVLGLKRQQSEGIRDPHAELLEQLTIDKDHIKRLAEAYLAQRKGRAPEQLAIAEPAEASA